MQIVQCPKCALRFEPFETESTSAGEQFCPQCGEHFSSPVPNAAALSNTNASAASQA